MDKEENECNHCDSGKINFIQKKTRKKIKVMIYTSLFVCIALTSGAIAATYIVEVRYGDKLKHLKINNNNPQIYYEDDDYGFVRSKNEDNRIASIIDEISNSMVGISDNSDSFLIGKNSDKNGTGVIVDEDGYIATNYNTIKNYNDIYVKLSSRGSKPIKASIVGEIKELDVAILKIDLKKLSVPNIKDVYNIKSGDRAILIGNPLSQENSVILTTGLICGNNERFIDENNEKRGYRLIKTEALINSSNTGGVLANEKGEVLGINSVELSNKFGDIGKVYVALSITDVVQWVDNLKLYNNKEKPNFGFVGDYIKIDSETEGIYIFEFLPGSPLKSAGLKPTDIILEVQGEKVNNINQVNEILNNYNFGNEVEVKTFRNGHIEKYKVKLVK